MAIEQKKMSRHALTNLLLKGNQSTNANYYRISIV